MKFSFVLEIDSEAQEKSTLINALSQSLEDYFKDKDYGNDIKTFYIRITCIKTKPGYEAWYKLIKPKYIDYSKTTSKLTGEILEVFNTFSYNVKIDNEDYEDFVYATYDVSNRILANMLVNSLSNLDSLPKKVKNFDKETFKNDFRLFFEDRELI